MTFKSKRKHQAAPPPPDWAQAEAIFDHIPHGDQRDRVLFRLMLTCRLKAFEVIRLRREDIVLADHTIQLTIRDKRGTPKRTITVTTAWRIHACLIAELRAYVQHTGWQTGPLFRMDSGREGQPLTLAIIHGRWLWYTLQANSSWTLRELRAG